MRLLNETTGELVEGRCKSANLCTYCRAMARLENTELLHLDAMDGNAPTVWLVLGTRTATLASDVFDEGVRLVMRAIRRRWPAAEYVAMVEYTTGYGPRAGGRRRPHLNLALKNVPAADLEQLRAAVVPVWCRHLDATPRAQFVGEINDGPGLFAYWVDHFSKKGQEPPEGWKGHRLRMSRGYLSMPTPEARKRARASLAWKRALWRAEHVVGLTGEAIVDYALEQQEAAAAASWRLLDIEAVTLAARRREEPRPTNAPNLDAARRAAARAAAARAGARDGTARAPARRAPARAGATDPKVWSQATLLGVGEHAPATPAPLDEDPPTATTSESPPPTRRLTPASDDDRAAARPLQPTATGAARGHKVNETDDF